MPELADYAHAVYASGLPSTAEVIADTQVNPARLTATLTESAFTGTEIGTGKAMLGHMTRLGVPALSAAGSQAFQDFSDALRDTPGAAFTDLAGAAMDCVASGGADCPDVVLDATLAAATEYLHSAVTQVPVLGWIVEWAALLVQVGFTVWGEAQGEPPTQLRPLQIDPAADTRAGNDVVNIMGQEDWTPLWMPEHDASEGGYLQAPEVGYPLSPEGTKVHYGWRLWMGSQPFTEGGAGSPVNWSGGMGLLPGQHAMARQWQVRGAQASTGNSRLDNILRRLNLPIAHGTGAASEIGKLTTYGMEYYLPSVGNLGSLAWAEVNKVGAAMYRVNTHTLAVAWDQYWDLWKLAITQLTDAGLDEAAHICLNVMGQNAMGDVFADWPQATTPEGLVTMVPEKYRNLIRGSLQEYGPEQQGWLPTDPPGCYVPGQPRPAGCTGGPIVYRAKRFVVGEGFSWSVQQDGITRRFLDNLYERQKFGVRTLQCAYLTGNEPGLQGQGSELFKLWESMRALLLQHPDLGAVDFDRVPKVDYTGGSAWRTEAVNRRIGGTFHNVGAMQAVATRGPVLQGGREAPMLAPLNAWGQGGFLQRMSTPPGKVRPAFVNADGMPALGERGGMAGPLVLAAVAGGLLWAFTRGRR